MNDIFYQTQSVIEPFTSPHIPLTLFVTNKRLRLAYNNQM